MRLHLGSFLLGVAVGATGATVARRARPVAVEVVALAYRLAEAVQARVAIGREALEDVVAEARARARGLVAETPSEDVAPAFAPGEAA